MKWSRWIVFSLASFSVLAVNAAEPKLISPRLVRVPVIPARYAADEPSTAPPAAVAAPAAAAPAASITPHAPVHYRLATWDIWSGTANGYVYAPGACDYTPPCVNQLWDGYVQRPHRCNDPHGHGCGGRHGCGSCNGGNWNGGGCNGCGTSSSCGCGGHSGMMKRAHAWHFGGKVGGCGCTSCGTMAPSCAAPSCAAPSCAAPSCGYDGGQPNDAPQAPAPKDAETPPAPTPTADGALPQYEVPAPGFENPITEKAARSKRLRGFTWPESPLQR